jgi:hypothetical protein
MGVVRVAVQIAGAFCVALGVGLFVFGQFMVPSDSQKTIQTMFRDREPSENLVMSAVFRGFGAGFFTLGVLGVALPFVIRPRSVEKHPAPPIT